ncbi:hypothetical protein Aple_025260 [Acrocarpospora pleiomorpha]|uniref:REase associating with pPIWI RE domain-containing protein n=1 Tax=Acrocarpospora pleiomorpha TaxID=90975 RepID=A0A5M3XEZ9_9ACTN|nr:hypothetical protein [Acrocarpospora pleiomorpha]GES19630.1 hypothetical protein Aple_025260 [Acrocarpospora pleiomorpha]
MNNEQAVGDAELRQTEALLTAAIAFAICGDALTRADLSGPGRLARIVEAQGALMAAAGPGHHIRFADLLDRLAGEQVGALTGLMPEWADPGSLEGFRLLDPDGVITSEGFDFRLEAELVIRSAKKVGRFAGGVTYSALEGEYSQEAVFSAIKGPFYERHRTSLIEYPVVLMQELEGEQSGELTLADLNLPTRALDFYQPIPQHARYQGWWFPCPACRWPMKISVSRFGAKEQGSARCLYPWHERTGASYLFRPTPGEPPVLHPAFECRVPDRPQAALWTGCVPKVPKARPVASYSALVRQVWRSTCIPGWPELRLHRAINAALEGTTWRAELWPDGDRIDLHIATGEGSRRKELFPADFKDYTFVTHLINKLHMDAGDKGDAEWLVVPDHRQEQIPPLDSTCRKYRMRAITASEYVQMVISAVREGRA